jgi:citrate lyase subunit gamma (acyl carrier protein)
MEIKKSAIAGTMESSDIMITLEPGGAGIEIDLQSTVEKQFGKDIRRLITETLMDLEVVNVKVKAVDKGALDCAIRARVKTAACRAAGKETYPWGAAKK